MIDEKLLDLVINQIKADMDFDDLEALYVLLRNIPLPSLRGYLGEEDLTKYDDALLTDANFNPLQVGDKIVIIHNEDEDLDEWYNNREEGLILTILKIDQNAELLWVEDCAFDINSACTLKVEE